MIQTPSGMYVDHICTGQCYELPSKEVDYESIKFSWAKMLKKEVLIHRLEPLKTDLICNCVSMPCGYPVYGCTCGQKDVVMELRYVPHVTGSSLMRNKSYNIEIYVSGKHTHECMLKIGKSLDNVIEDEVEREISHTTDSSVTVTTVTDIKKTLPFIDYSYPLFKLKKGKGYRGGNWRKFKKNHSKNIKNKSTKHHVDVRIDDPLSIPKSDSLFWDEILNKNYSLSCKCEEDRMIKLNNSAQAFYSDFRCSTCNSITGLSELIKYMYEFHCSNLDYCDYHDCYCYDQNECYCDEYF